MTLDSVPTSDTGKALRFRVGIDVGGTFTDVVAVDDNGKSRFAKVLTDQSNPAQSAILGLEQIVGSLQLEVGKVGIEQVVHGTTVATNALVERQGAAVLLLTTMGHRDVLEMREGFKPDRYNLRLARPDPLVPRERRVEVSERVLFDGSIHQQLDEDSLRSTLETFADDPPTSVAICLLHSYAFDGHERSTARIVQEMYPQAYQSQSSVVLPQIGEYARLCTTVIDAYVKPSFGAYVRQLERALVACGYSDTLWVMQSHGGVLPAQESSELAAGAVLSGPAGGVAAIERFSRACGHPNLISFDMGGTSTDIAMLSGGHSTIRTSWDVAGLTVALPSLDIVTIGAGGGSIARVDGSGLLRVGPDSAGSTPGPASYDRGGELPTVTDAAVVVGMLAPSDFSQELAVSTQLAELAIAKLAAPMNVGVAMAAFGVLDVICTKMADAIRLAAIRRGMDPRDNHLVAIGGAAGLYAADVARRVGMTSVLIPDAASAMAAWGLLAAPLRFDRVKSCPARLENVTSSATAAHIDELRNDLCARFTGTSRDNVVIDVAFDLRYGDQVFETTVRVNDVSGPSEGLRERLRTAFEQRHLELYGFTLPGQEVWLVNIRATGRLTEQRPLAMPHPIARPGQADTRRVFGREGWRDVPVIDLGDLRADVEVPGPLLIRSQGTTIHIPDGDRIRRYPGWIDVGVRAE